MGKICSRCQLGKQTALFQGHVNLMLPKYLFFVNKISCPIERMKIIKAPFSASVKKEIRMILI